MNSKTTDRISELLAAYGSDLSRWPEEGRQLVAALTPEERAETFRADQAFDALLAGAARDADDAPAPAALMARILRATGEDTASRPILVHDVAEDEPNSDTAADTYRVAEMRRHRTREWSAAAALLAASLVLGIFVGSTERGQSTAISLGTFAGLNMSSPPMMTTALDEAMQLQEDEDIL